MTTLSPEDGQSDEFLNMHQVAALLNISLSSAYRLGDRGHVTPVKTGLCVRRYRRNEVERLVGGLPRTPGS